MIKYNNKTINDWYFDTSDIIKVYRNNAVCYYKVSGSPSPTAQTPCFAVVDDITQYSDTEFVDVYDKLTEKWYKLNNLDEYEEYGIYGEGLNITYYDGKLTKYDGDEYKYTGGTWVNVGEISGSTITIKSPEYIEKNSSFNGKINLGVVLQDTTKFQFKFNPTSAGGAGIIGENDAPSDNDDYRVFWSGSRLYYDYGNQRINAIQALNTIYEFEIGNYYIKNMATSATVLTGATQTVATSHTRNIWLGEGNSDYWLGYYLKVYDGVTLIRDFIPWADMNGNYGLFDKVSMQVFSATSGSFTASTVINDVTISGGETLPVEYEEIDIPPAELSFDTMEEALAYECPYVGVIATIGGDLYMFNSDYEWEELSFNITGMTTSDSNFTILLNNTSTNATVYGDNGDGTYNWGIVTMSAITSTTYMCSGNTDIKTFDFYNADTSNLTSIGQSAFQYCSGLTNVDIPNSVTSIGNSAFINCSVLSSVAIPSGVTSIGNAAFQGCSSLTSVTIPSGVTTIGRDTFQFCRSLSNINIPSGVTSIGNSAFYQTAITSCTIPSGVTSISNSLFYSCTSLKSVDLPSGITSIGTDAFNSCISLSSITIPDRVRTINGTAFANCSNLTSVDIPDSVTSLGGYVFSRCTNLSSVTIGSGVTGLSTYLFENCSKLTNVTIPNSVTSIANAAFYNCTSLPSVNIPSGVTSIGTSAFFQCTSLQSIIIPSGVTSISSQVFISCNNLSAVTIPNSVTSIGSSAFQNCSGLTSIDIPDNVTSIGNKGFQNCYKLSSVTIPDGITSLSQDTFQNCSGLTSVTIGSGVTSIGQAAFRNCNSLPSITIPSGVTSIGNYAFDLCSGLTSITCLATTPPTLGNSPTTIFGNTNNYPIYVPSASVDTYKATSGWSTFASRIQAIP